MVLTLYHFPASAPSRGALLAAKLAEVNIDVKIIDLFTKQQMRPEFVKINPQHTIPTLVDGNFTLWDSHAIGPYLVQTYCPESTLYSDDPRKKAIIDQRLQFDCGTMYPRIRQICFPVLFLGENQIHDEHKVALEEAFGFLDIFLDGQDFVCGDTLTLADLSLIASVSSIVAVGWKLQSYTNVQNWVKRCERSIPDFYESNQEGAEIYGKAVKSKLARGQI